MLVVLLIFQNIHIFLIHFPSAMLKAFSFSNPKQILTAALTCLTSNIFKNKITSKWTAEAKQAKKSIYLYFILHIIQLYIVQSLGKKHRKVTQRGHQSFKCCLFSNSKISSQNVRNWHIHDTCLNETVLSRCLGWALEPIKLLPACSRIKALL